MSRYFLFFTLFFFSCGIESNTPLLTATTSQIGDALRRITLGLEIQIKVLCGPGVDPHTHQASLQDLENFQTSRLIFANGFNLEAQLHDILEERFTGKVSFASEFFPEDKLLAWVTNGEVDPRKPFDPHVWNDLLSWKEVVRGFSQVISSKFPESREIILQNTSDYLSEINFAHEEALSIFNSLAPEKKFLVTGHDAFEYFARAYGLKSRAIQGLSTEMESDIKTIQDLAMFIVENKISTVFLENQLNNKATLALADAVASKGSQVVIPQQNLFSDDVGATPPLDTLVGTFSSNVRTIAYALR